MDIARRGVIHEYRGHAPTAPISRPPYILEDTEKISKKLWKDMRDGVMQVCERDLASGVDQLITHHSSVVRAKLHGPH